MEIFLKGNWDWLFIRKIYKILKEKQNININLEEINMKTQKILWLILTPLVIIEAVLLTKGLNMTRTDCYWGLGIILLLIFLSFSYHVLLPWMKWKFMSEEEKKIALEKFIKKLEKEVISPWRWNGRGCAFCTPFFYK